MSDRACRGRFPPKRIRDIAERSRGRTFSSAPTQPIESGIRLRILEELLLIGSAVDSQGSEEGATVLRWLQPGSEHPLTSRDRTRLTVP